MAKDLFHIKLELGEEHTIWNSKSYVLVFIEANSYNYSFQSVWEYI